MTAARRLTSHSKSVRRSSLAKIYPQIVRNRSWRRGILRRYFPVEPPKGIEP